MVYIKIAKRLSRCPNPQISWSHLTLIPWVTFLAFRAQCQWSVFHFIPPACLLIRVKTIMCDNCLDFFMNIKRTLLCHAKLIQSMKTEIFHFPFLSQIHCLLSFYSFHFMYQLQFPLPPLLPPSTSSILTPQSTPHSGLGLPWEVNKVWHTKLRQDQAPPCCV